MDRHQFTNVSIDWLREDISEKGDFDPELSFQHISYPIPPELGVAFGEMIRTRDGVSLYSATHRYVKNTEQRFLKLGEIQVDFEEDSLYIEAHTGTVIHQDQFPKTELEIHPGQAAFYHTRKMQFIPFHDTHRIFSSSIISIPIYQLRELFDSTNVDKLLDALAITQPPAVNIVSFLPSFRELLEDAFSTHMTGKLREVHIQSRVLEFLCTIIQHYTQNEEVCEIEANKLVAIHTLHEQLLHLEGKLPTMAELTRQTGLGQGELNKLYEKEYGLPIHRFIQRQRLIEAHEIIQVTNTPLKHLAGSLGYSHVNHFNTAFSKQFGYAPGSLRKKNKNDK